MTSAAPARARLESIDALRGVIMIVMAIDHTRDFFAIPGQDPTNMATTTVALFFTRWVTHFCAPVFALLAGAGAALSLGRRSPGELARFLLTRGLWLVLLEVTVVRCLSYQFNFDYRVTMLIVLWSLGCSMIALALVVRLPPAAVAAIGLVLVGGHDLFDSVVSPKPLWAALEAPGFLLDTPRHVVFTPYPLVPWIGVVFVGYGLGFVYRWDAARRRALLWRLGLAAILAFVVLRDIDGYGDPSPWSPQRTKLFTVLSFLNTTKYPPSLLFLLMTLGPALVFLWALDQGTPRALRPAVIVGKVPLFYYVVHFTMIHLLAAAVCFVRFGSARWLTESPDLAHYPFSPPAGWGCELPGVYLVWAIVVVAMYPLCRWFAAVKGRRRDAWLSYL